MAIAVTAVIAGTYYKSWTFTALDADTAATVVHGFGFTPDFLGIMPSVAFATTATPNFAATADATNIYLQKSAATGSGGLTAGTTVIGKLYAWKPHSLII
jgi:hypothetical protein